MLDVIQSQERQGALSSFCVCQRRRCHLKADCVLNFASIMHQPGTWLQGSLHGDAVVRELITHTRNLPR